MSGLELFHQIGTVVFALGSLFVAGRLIWLSRKTGHRPELFLGLGIGGSVLGYGVMIMGMAFRDPDMSLPGTGLSALLQGAGQAIHNFGLTASLLFVISAFRPSDGWARGLFAAMMLCLWGGFAGVGVASGFRTNMIGEPLWLLQYSIIWVYPMWSMLESFRYHAMMRRRSALGLADPLVVNRFFLWGFASLLTGVTIWVSSITFAIYAQPVLLEHWTPMIRVATAGLGLTTITCYALTFFPPKRYALWLRGDWTPGESQG